MIAWLCRNAGTISDLFGLLASVCLFIPLISLAGAARQFRQFGDLVKRDGVSSEQIETFRRQMVHQRFGDGQVPWLVAAGICFGLAFAFFVVAAIGDDGAGR